MARPRGVAIRGTRAQHSYYTIQQVADIIQRDYVTVYRYIHARKLPASKVEGGWLILDDDLARFMHRNKHALGTRRNLI